MVNMCFVLLWMYVLIKKDGIYVAIYCLR